MDATWINTVSTVVIGVLTVFLVIREQASKKRSDDLKTQLQVSQLQTEKKMLEMENRLAAQFTSGMLTTAQGIEHKLQDIWKALDSQRLYFEGKFDKLNERIDRHAS